MIGTFKRNLHVVPNSMHTYVYIFLRGLLFLLQLLDMLKFYSRFEISDETGDPLTDHDMTQLHYSKITSLQVSGANVKMDGNLSICSK